MGTTEEKVIHGYKGFDKDFKCRGFQFKEGETYTETDVVICEKGFHFCENPLDVFRYYSPADSRFAAVSGTGKTMGKHDDDSKVACSELHVSAEITLPALLGAGVKFILDKIDWTNKKESNTGDRSAATNTGNWPAATNTGNYSAATNTGDYSAATNTGNYSAATNTGDYSAATNTGYQSAATNTGNYSAATNTGYQSAATNTGNYSAATNTGDYSAATNTGDQSAATNTGDQSAATVGGADSIACGLGYGCRARGAVGCWIVLAERGEDYVIRSVKAARVDGKKIKADTFYVLRDGKFIEAE